jgi:hypothetical protein
MPSDKATDGAQTPSKSLIYLAVQKALPYKPQLIPTNVPLNVRCSCTYNRESLLER